LEEFSLNLILNSLAEELLDAVIILKLDLHVIYINDSCERIFQFSRNKLKLQQTSITQLFPSLSKDTLINLTNKYNKISLTTFEQLQNDFLVKVKFTKIDNQELVFIIIKEYEFEASMLDKYKKNVFDLRAINKSLEDVIKSKTVSFNKQKELIDLIFTKAPLGLVTFNSNGEIFEAASEYFYHIFGYGKDLLGLVKGIDKNFQENLSLWLEQIQYGDVPLEDLINLSPDGFTINQTNFKTLFIPLASNFDDKFFLMVFFENKDQQVNSQSLNQNQLIDKDLFLSLYLSFREKFFSKTFDILDYSQLLDLLILLHSLKGILHLFGFNQEVEILHRLEDRFESFKSLKAVPEYKFFNQFFLDLKLLDSQIMDQIGDKNDYLSFNVGFNDIKNYFSHLSPSKQRELGVQLFSKSFKDSSWHLSLFLEKECQLRMIKCLPLNITNTQFRIPHWSWRRLIPLLTTIIRNSIAHGVVYDGPNQKFPLEVGLSLLETNDTIILNITDNGSGFPLDFSLSKSVDQLSGRKIGLLGLQKDVEELKGRLELYNLELGGACCKMTFPTEEFFCVEK
jgi:hypothetical protein